MKTSKSTSREVTVNIPGDMEAVNGSDDKKIKGVGWQLKRKWPKIGRNEPCPCGSGMKFKNCKHLKS